MSTLSQFGAITVMNLRNISQRIGTSLIVVIGIAGVVAVSVSVLAMGEGLTKAMLAAGRDDRAIVMRSGAASEMTSSLSGDDLKIIADAPGVKRDAKGAPIYSAETITLVRLRKRDASEVGVPLRGVGLEAFALRPEIKVVAGRVFENALREVIVGKSVLTKFPDLRIGSDLAVRGTILKVVGVFESNGDTHEGELMTSSTTLLSAVRRFDGAQAVTVMLDSRGAFSTFKDSLTSDPNLSVEVLTEREYFSQQSKGTGRLLSIVAYVVGGIMAIGAVLGALNTMYSAVSKRAVEIATLRAIGFGTGPIITSVLAEALLLALIGGTIGAFLAWLFFNGYTVSTTAGGAAAESRVFSLYVSAKLIALGLVWSCLIGFIGGLFPSIRAARLPIATALRPI